MKIHDTWRKLDGDRWEFECPECGYHAQYSQEEGFCVLNYGDVTVRHSSASKHIRDNEWVELPEHLEEQIDAIFRRGNDES